MKGKWKYLIFRNFIPYIHNCTVMLNSCHDIKIKFSLWNRLSWKLNSAFFFFKMINQLLVSKYKSVYMHYKKTYLIQSVWSCMLHNLYTVCINTYYTYWNLTEFCIIFWTYISLLIYINTIDVNFVFCI